MGRRRKHHKHLPVRMQFRRGSYYHVSRDGQKQRWVNLGRDYGDALSKWAVLEGESAATTTTVADALSAYLADRAGRLSARTLAGYQAQAKTLGAVFGSMRLGDLTRAHVYTYLRKRGNVAGNRERDLLRAAYNHAANIGYAGTNPCANMRSRNPEAPRRRYITDDEFGALLAAASPRLALLLRFLYLTAMRVSDAISLPLTAADADGIRWGEGKTKRPRFVEWSDELRDVWRQAAGNRIGAQAVFRGQRGPYTLDGIESTFARVRKRSGVVDVRLHDIRRKAASDLSLTDAQALLGHASPGITQKHYRAKADPVKPTR